jgi:hypothetical protein
VKTEDQPKANLERRLGIQLFIFEQVQTALTFLRPTAAGIIIMLLITSGCTTRSPHTIPAVATIATPTPDRLSAIDPAARCYIDAVNSRDPDAVVACFAANGRVVDINQQITGPDAIRRWVRTHVIGGHLEVLKEQSYDGGVIVLVHWAPRTTAGWLVWYRFEFKEGKLTLANRQNA